MPSAPWLEVCVDSVASARAAIAGGADQIELCSALALGGLTPSPALTEAVVALARPAGIAVRAMVRPRPGDFAYDADELALAAAEARALLAIGVDGLVFGAARDGMLDHQAIGEWRRAAAPPAFTIHRAVDTTRDLLAATDDAIALGADQVLSSGGAGSAIAGAAALGAMTRHAGARCRVVAAAGITPDNAGLLIAAGVRAIHGSARAVAETRAADGDRFGFGRSTPPADEATVRALRRAFARAADRCDA